MNIGVLTIAYREEKLIERALKQVRPFVERQVVLISDKPWRGKKIPMDRTPEIARKYADFVVIGSWDEEIYQRNTGVDMLKDMDWILMIDADEYYEQKDLKKLIKFLETAEKPAYGIKTIKTYWKTPEYIIDPPEGGGHIVAVKPTVKFNETRCVDSEWKFIPEDIVMHHWSYVRDNEAMKKKISTFHHADEVYKGWYAKKWLAWDKDHSLEDLHPVQPEAFKKAIKVGEQTLDLKSIKPYLDHPDGVDYFYEKVKKVSQKLPPEYIFVEVGSRQGGSTLAMMQAVQHSGKQRWLFTIDPYGQKPFKLGEKTLHPYETDYGEDSQRIAMDVLSSYARDHRLLHCHWRMTSLDFMKIFSQIEFWCESKVIKNPQFGFVYLDGDHHSYTVEKELKWFLERMPKGGMVVIDDIPYVDKNDIPIIKQVIKEGEQDNYRCYFEKR